MTRRQHQPRTVNEAAAQLGISRWTVLALIHSGDLEASRKGRATSGPGVRYSIDQAAIDRRIEAQRVTAA